jgi:type III pantothenate kinase
VIVTVDAGNSRVKVSLAGPSRVTALFSVPTSSMATEVRRFARALDVRAGRLRSCAGAAVCSVAPEVDRLLVSELRRVTGKSVFVLTHRSRLPFELGVADAAKVGADRIAAAAGAVGVRRRHAIVVDVGSAVTVDLVLAGRFRGGLIMCGPHLGLRALGDYARRLPRIELEWSRKLRPGRFDDTEPAMVLGARAGAIGGILEGVHRLRSVSRSRPAVFLTGGGARFVSSGLPAAWTRDPHLVERGLYLLWSLNGGPQRAGRAKKNA